MKVIFASLAAILLLPIAAFCVFGFMATFEPTNQPDVFMAFRIGYAVVGTGACLLLQSFDRSALSPPQAMTRRRVA